MSVQHQVKHYQLFYFALENSQNQTVQFGLWTFYYIDYVIYFNGFLLQSYNMMSKRGEESNPFYFDEDEGDNPYNKGNTAEEDELWQTKAAIARSEDRQEASLDRSLRVLKETEYVGFQTAEVKS